MSEQKKKTKAKLGLPSKHKHQHLSKPSNTKSSQKIRHPRPKSKSTFRRKSILEKYADWSDPDYYMNYDPPPNDYNFLQGDEEDEDFNKPCPEKNSDSEYERERSKFLALKCKTYDHLKSDSEDEDNNLKRHQAIDFESILTYEDYLDHYVTSSDVFYFDSEETARTIVSLGFSVPELLNKKQFQDIRQRIEEAKEEKKGDTSNISREIPAEEIKGPLMKALAEREIANRTGHLATIIYIRTINAKREEVSAWIDYRMRLQTDNQELWFDYFTGKKKLTPNTNDLCYYNWSTFSIRYNSSENYLVTTDIKEGLKFMNKLDLKFITVRPNVDPGDNTELFRIKSPIYLDCQIYDHSLRVKA